MSDEDRMHIAFGSYMAEQMAPEASADDLQSAWHSFSAGYSAAVAGEADERQRWFMCGLSEARETQARSFIEIAARSATTSAAFIDDLHTPGAVSNPEIEGATGTTSIPQEG